MRKRSNLGNKYANKANIPPNTNDPTNAIIALKNVEQKANQKPMFKIRLDKLREVAPKIKDNEFEAFVVKACAYYYKHQQKEKMKDAR